MDNLKIFLKALGWTVGTELTFLGAASALKIETTFVTDFGWYGYYFACSIPIIICLTYALYKSNATNNEINIISTDFIVSIFEYFEKCKIENDFEEIIRFGSAITRPLWLSQKYESRKKVGEYLYNAAIQTKNADVKIKSLIDDIGWTSVELSNFIEAEKSIIQGIELAKKENSQYYIAKGYRHLFGLYYRKGNDEKAAQFLTTAIEETYKIEEGRQKIEAVAEINYSQSLLAFNNENFENALVKNTEAENMYSTLNSKEWLIKIAIQKAEILIKQKDFFNSEEIISQCILNSKTYHFNKQLVRSFIAQGRFYFEKHHHKKAELSFNEALKIAEKIQMTYECSIINNELSHLKTLES